MKNKIYLYVDDERSPKNKIPDEYMLVIVRAYHLAIDMINFCGAKKIPLIIDLDHDLGEAKTGYDICKYIIEHNIRPIQYRIHSMNVVGAMNMKQLMDHYNYKQYNEV